MKLAMMLGNEGEKYIKSFANVPVLELPYDLSGNLDTDVIERHPDCEFLADKDIMIPEYRIPFGSVGKLEETIMPLLDMQEKDIVWNKVAEHPFKVYHILSADTDIHNQYRNVLCYDMMTKQHNIINMKRKVKFLEYILQKIPKANMDLAYINLEKLICRTVVVLQEKDVCSFVADITRHVASVRKR